MAGAKLRRVQRVSKRPWVWAGRAGVRFLTAQRAVPSLADLDATSDAWRCGSPKCCQLLLALPLTVTGGARSTLFADEETEAQAWKQLAHQVAVSCRVRTQAQVSRIWVPPVSHSDPRCWLHCARLPVPAHLWQPGRGNCHGTAECDSGSDNTSKTEFGFLPKNCLLPVTSHPP